MKILLISEERFVQIFKSIILFVSIAHAGNLQIDSVVVRDHPKLLPHVGMRIFESVKGSPVDENVSEAAFKIWSQTPFLSNASHVSLARYRSSKIAAVISMDPVFNSHVSGMVGTGKNPSGFWESQGEINLHLENVWATAGALDVSWSVSEPYLPVVPIGLHAGWKEHLQDAMSLLRATEFSALLHSQHGWTWKTGYRKTTIRPTDAAQKEGFESSLSETAVLGLSKITVDHPWLPKSGFKFDAFAEFGVEERTVSASSIASAKVEAAYFYPVSDRWIWMTGLKSSGTFSGSGSILPAQQVRFGGMQSLREKSLLLTGYLEYLLDEASTEAFTIISPRNREERGCQLSLQFGESAKSVHKRLNDEGIICDYREPGVIRVAPVPFYNSFMDVFNFVEGLKKLL